MESPHLNPDDDRALEELLQRTLAEPPLPDNGFSNHVMASLPPRRRPTSFAFRRDDVVCVVRGEWDGGDDSDPKSQPGDWYRVTVICARGIPAKRF